MITVNRGIITHNKGKLLLTEKDKLSFWSLEDYKIVNEKKLENSIDVYYTQLMKIEHLLLIMDLKNSKYFLYDINSDNIKSIEICTKTLLNDFISQAINDNDIILDARDSNSFFKLDKNSLTVEGFSSILLRKFAPHFRRIENELFPGTHNILYTSNNSETILFHYRDYDQTKSEIGVYITVEEKKITQFEAPEPVAYVNFFTGFKDEHNTNVCSNVKGCLVADRIVLCYQHVLYVLDYGGKVLQKRQATENSRYWGFDNLNDSQLLIAELDPNDPDKMFVFAYDV
ncbi:hypothetical protein [Chryseobacterium sp. Hurlbut01]|jgi:hypothetical protein|uniref:hypothetical protein n=1 Tax=Chryseobacterium sp. Hurlbut01 TaxID=1681828 RepID=UPI00067C81C1|nr:hypothetical protein [Chryseobacterium sp. Hurlbut01]KNB60041.1 hypothetical protein AC804_12415 [Chryseobacterium sp. Hurlbut01]